MRRIIAAILYLLCAASAVLAADAVSVQAVKAAAGDVSVQYEYIGVVEPVQTVQVKPEVSAKVRRVHFRDGAFVKAGATLFTLDSAQYSATVALRKADLASAQAGLTYAKKYLARLKASDKRSVPAADLESAESNVARSEAAVAAAKASLQLAQNDLAHTKITAPISGRTGVVFMTQGNYAGAGSVLAVIVQTDPMRVNISVPYSDYALNKDKGFHADILLPDGTVYPEYGTHDFDDNNVNTTTGTISQRWSFPNHDNILIPGATVRVILKPSESRKGIIIPQAAILSDSEGRYVFVIENGNTAHVRRITAGNELGRNIEVTSGLETGESVAVQGIQMLYEGAEVSVHEYQE